MFSHLLQLPSLQNKPFWTDTRGDFILLLKAYRPHRFRIQSTEWDIPGGSFNTVFCGCIKSRGQSHGAQHLFGIYASVVAPKVDLCRPPTVLTRSRSETCLCMRRITQGREYLMHVLIIVRYSAIHQARHIAATVDWLPIGVCGVGRGVTFVFAFVFQPLYRLNY